MTWAAIAAALITWVSLTIGYGAGYRAAYREMGLVPPPIEDDGMRAP